HQFDMPDAPPPEAVRDEIDIRKELMAKHPELFEGHPLGTRPIEFRPIDPADLFNPVKQAPRQMAWMRTRGVLPDDPRLHQCVLAYLSDWSLLDTATLPHGISYLQHNIQMASLDHAMWFHRPFRADEWLLYVQDSPSASGARGFNRGLIYSRDGALVASATQEGLMRVHARTPPGGSAAHTN
ncbi:MAG: acyl-CoA thioesterase II, partial [Gammaproteobacteria bacterium]|nr:acyl-CoA thioesterase II [Gammaproteobacteria bacterium]